MEAGFIYFVHADGTNRYKIGLTNDLDRRMKELNGKQSPFENRLQWSIEVSDMRSAEKDLHDRFDARRVNGEWFQFAESELDEVESIYDHVADKYPSRRYQSEPEYPQPQYSSGSYDRENGAGYLVGCAIAAAIMAGVAIAFSQGFKLQQIKMPSLPFLSTHAVTTQPVNNVRRSPNGERVCQLPRGQAIEVSDERDGWYRTDACGGGFIHESVISK